VTPLDVRIEAVMYAQEGSFFIIPGPWFNPNPNDTYERYIAAVNPTRFLRRDDEAATTEDGQRRVSPRFPFHKQPQDIRITFFGAIAENLPAESGDQAAWMEKWGWIPRYSGSTGLPHFEDRPPQGAAVATAHGPQGGELSAGRTGNGIQYVYDVRGVAPYSLDPNGITTRPLRSNPYYVNDPLPVTPRLPVAPGLLYFGEAPPR